MTAQFQDPEAICTQLLRVSQRMMESGAQADWSTLAELDRRRLELGRQIVANPAPGTALSEMLEECLKLDKDILALCEDARARVVGELRSVSQGRRLHAAYGGGH